MRCPGAHWSAWLLVLLLCGTPPLPAADLLGLETLADEVPAIALVAAEDGAALTLADLRGKTVLLHFWATWCKPCKEELPALDSLTDDLDAARFAVVLVAIDTNTAPAEVLAYARHLGVRLPVYVAG